MEEKIMSREDFEKLKKKQLEQIKDPRFWTLVKSIKKRVRKDYDLVMAICGEEGKSKSTLALILGMAIDEHFYPEDNVMFSPKYEEVSEKLKGDVVKRYGAAILDEAIDVLYKMRSTTKLQIFLKKLFAKIRFKNKISILCMPYFNDFDAYMRKQRIKLWIQINARGVGVWKIKDGNYYLDDPWHMKENRRIINKLTDKISDYGNFDFLDTKQKIKIESQTKTFAGWFEYPKLIPEIDSYYRALREKYKWVSEEEGNVEEDKYVQAQLKHLKSLYDDHPDWSLEKYGEAIGVSIPTVVRRMNILKKEGEIPEDANTMQNKGGAFA